MNRLDSRWGSAWSFPEPAVGVEDYASALEERIDALFKARRLASRSRLLREAQAFVRAAVLDMGHALASSLASSETAIAEAFSAALARLAGDDMGCRIEMHDPRLAYVQHAFDHAASGLRQRIGGIDHSAGVVAARAQEVAGALSDQVTQAELQARLVEEIAAAIRRASHLAAEATRQAGQSADHAQKAAQATADSQRAAARMEQAIKDMEGCSRDVTRIVEDIEGIAFQTSLLALNAGIEASRQTGGGFAIVAAEVRVLAQRTAEAAAEIRAHVIDHGKQVSVGAAMAADAQHTLAKLAACVDDLGGGASSAVGTAGALAEHLAGAGGSLGDLESIARNGPALAAGMESAARSLAAEALRLGGQAALFGSADVTNRHGQGEGRCAA